jgi:hypothetical protein
VSTATIPAGDTGLTTPGSLSGRRWRRETRKQLTAPWYRRATETERSEMNDGESEHPDSTVEVGELVLDEDPSEGSGMSHQTTDVGNYGECTVT